MSTRARRRSRPRVETLEGRAIPSTGLSGARAAATAPASRNIVYTIDQGLPLALDVYRPNGPPPADGWPAILAIHGGGWRRFSKEQYGPKAAPLTGLGFVVIAPDYTLSSPSRPSWPAAIGDVRDAVRWVRAHAAELDVNPGRIAAMGESAGGHLAALVGADPGDPSARVNAVVDISGPADLNTIMGQSPAAAAAVRQFLGGSPAQLPQSYADASPTSHVGAETPPTLILQGTADPIVPVAQARELDADLAGAGVPHRLVVLRGAGHGFGFQVNGRNLLPLVAGFLQGARPLTARS